MKRVFPVIHAVTEEQVAQNAKIAADAGADGVFVINHGFAPAELVPLIDVALKHIPWVGANFLGLGPVSAMQLIADRAQGLWTDNARIDDESEDQPHAQAVLDLRQERVWDGEYFGGVAFKYQQQPKSVYQAALKAASYMDVVCTSGPGTGQAAHLDKIRSMREALDDWMCKARLGIASGVTPDNVENYLPYVDDYLVATGISQDFHNLDLKLTTKLVERVRSHDAV